MRLLLLSLLPFAAFAADPSAFNGRWDLKPNVAGKAWWLEVSHAGTPQIEGRFVGFPGGDMEKIPQIAVEDGKLKFSVDKMQRPNRQSPARKVHLQFVASLNGDRMTGSLHSEIEDVTFTGVRAPALTSEHDDGTWKEGASIELFDGKDLSGWHAMVPGRELGWTVKDGLLTSTGSADNLVSDRKFWNFKLHVEYRIGANGNSGIGLRGRYEVQIQDDYNKPIESHINGALYSRIAPTANASKPAGEWQSVDIRLVGREVTVVLNDQKIIDRKTIEGLTAIAFDADEGQPGPIVLQGDHRPVEFRRVRITPLSR